MGKLAGSWPKGDGASLHAIGTRATPVDEPEEREETVAVLPEIVPRRLAALFGALAILLIPWIIYLGYSLPPHTISRHYNVSWVGFDLLLLFALSRTAILAYHGRRDVQLPAIVTATLLVVDAWFDVTSAHRGWPLAQSLLLAVFIELPLAGVCLYVARRVERLTRRDQE
jgi:hypothetical protein